MLDIIKIFIYIFVRACMHIFYIFPIKNNRLIFESYQGRSYTCNPKYICEYINDATPGKYEMIWVFNDPKKFSDIPYIKSIKRNSIIHFFYHLTSKVIIANMVDELYLPKRKNQMFINTWHAGGAYKKVGLSFDTNKSKWKDWQEETIKQETSCYISSSELFTKYNIEDAYHYNGLILKCGMPRNDVFFDQNKMLFLKHKVREFYNLHDQIIVLYAPTFRGDYAKTEKLSVVLPFIEVTQTIKNIVQKEVIILNRSHYADGKKYETSNEIIDATYYPDMQELLVAADILITDYSSSMWDFALTGKPCFIYAVDYDQYVGSRGTYTSIETWPGIVSKSKTELLDNLIKIKMPEVFKDKARNHLVMFDSYENGKASEAVFEIITEGIE